MNTKIEVIKKAWRESATLLVLGRNMIRNPQSTECNYKVNWARIFQKIFTVLLLSTRYLL